MILEKRMRLILNIVTASYLLSLIVMAFWTNIRPFYINHWNRTEMLDEMNISVEQEPEIEMIDIIMVVNLVAVAFTG